MNQQTSCISPWQVFYLKDVNDSLYLFHMEDDSVCSHLMQHSGIEGYI